MTTHRTRRGSNLSFSPLLVHHKIAHNHDVRKMHTAHLHNLMMTCLSAISRRLRIASPTEEETMAVAAAAGDSRKHSFAFCALQFLPKSKRNKSSQHVRCCCAKTWREDHYFFWGGLIWIDQNRVRSHLQTCRCNCFYRLVTEPEGPKIAEEQRLVSHSTCFDHLLVWLVLDKQPKVF